MQGLDIVEVARGLGDEEHVEGLGGLHGDELHGVELRGNELGRMTK